MSLDYALRADPQPDIVARFPSSCPQHLQGDEARLDFRAEGWPDAVCSAPYRSGHKKCKPVWRLSILCDVMFTEFYCEKELPKELRGHMLP
jgi:hypothetical protein